MTLRADIASVATLRITTAYHLFDCLLYVGLLVGRNLSPAIIPPAFPVVDKDFPKPVTTVLCRRMKQQDCRRSKGGDGQHSLAGVNETDIIADRVFGLLSVVPSYGSMSANSHLLIDHFS